eukprot:457782-Rhodomonas_salina.2
MKSRSKPLLPAPRFAANSLVCQYRTWRSTAVAGTAALSYYCDSSFRRTTVEFLTTEALVVTGGVIPGAGVPHSGQKLSSGSSGARQAAQDSRPPFPAAFKLDASGYPARAENEE